MTQFTELWAFTADNDGVEGIVAMGIGGVWMPMVSGTEKNIDAMREQARRIANDIGKEIRLTRWTEPVVVEIIKPEIPPQARAHVRDN